MSSADILIVEDEAITAMDIELRLKRMGFHVVGQVHNPSKVIAEIKRKKPQLVLLDINLKGNEEGIDLAEEIATSFNIPVVFLTAFGDDSTFKKAMSTHPYGYVTKPFKDKDLKHTLEIALTHHQSLSFAKTNAEEYKNLLSQISVTTNKSDKKDLFIKGGSKYIKVSLEEIQWIEAYDAYSKIHTKEKTIIANALLKDLHQKLPQNKFIRVHRSYIIEITHIEKIDKDNIYVSGNEIPISKSYKSALMKHLDII